MYLGWSVVFCFSCSFCLVLTSDNTLYWISRHFKASSPSTLFGPFLGISWCRWTTEWFFGHNSRNDYITGILTYWPLFQDFSPTILVLTVNKVWGCAVVCFCLSFVILDLVSERVFSMNPLQLGACSKATPSSLPNLFPIAPATALHLVTRDIWIAHLSYLYKPVCHYCPIAPGLWPASTSSC